MPSASKAKSRRAAPAHRNRRRDVAVWLGLLLVMSLIGYGQLLMPGKTPYSPHSDFISEHISTKQVLYDSIWAGEGIPLWRNDQFSGYAGLVSPQSQYTNPLHFLFYLLPPLSAAGPTFWLHFVAAGAAYYLLGASMGLKFWPRVVMSAAGLFSCKLILATYAGWLPNIPIMIAFPLLFAAVFHFVRRPGLPRALLMAAAGALCLHCGHLQLLYYSLWMLLVYALVWAVQRLAAKDGATVLRAACWAVAAGALAVALSAYLILPLAAEAPLLSRSRSTYEFFIGGHAVQPKHLATFILPEALGTPLDGSYPGDELWEDLAYFGLLPLALAIGGVLMGWRRHPTKFLAVCFAASLFLSMDTPVLRFLFDYLPGFSLFRIPARFLFMTTFFGIALAGVGLQELSERMARNKAWAKRAGALAAALIVLITLEGAYYARRYVTTAPHSVAVPDTDYQRYLAADEDIFRTAPVGRWTISYGWAQPMGLQLISGYDSFNYRQYAEFFDLLQWGEIKRTIARAWYDLVHVVKTANLRRLACRGDMMDVLNVKYIVSPIPLEFPDEHFEQVAEYADQPMFRLYYGMRRTGVWIYRNRRFLPRAFFADEVVAVRRPEEIIPAIQFRDLRTTAVVLADRDQAPAPTTQATGPADVTVTHAWHGKLDLATRGEGRRFLVVSEIWHPGWRAKIDGAEAVVYRTDHALLGVEVPPGEHAVEIRFRPLRWHASLAISAVGAAAFMLLTAVAVVKRRRPGKAAKR